MAIKICKLLLKDCFADTLNRGRSIRGFSLIEASISLLIVGIVSSICVSQLSMFMAVNRMQKTQTNCEIVVRALGLYMKRDGVLPGPVGADSTGFGRVPFKAIGIMESFARDGNGHWLLYKSNPHFGKMVTDPHLINLGISEFSGMYGDKVAFVLKSVSSTNAELYKIWYSEKNFTAMFQPQRFEQPRPQYQSDY
jgi:prepilin-type N-terminal cleavage/methylation domain-containing protein